MNHEDFMKKALILAEEAEKEGEVPVGAVVVCDGEIVGTGRNRRETEKNALCHAEIEAIDNACKNLGGWRLFKCDLYVTLEPCPMCAGAIINSRIKNVYFGANDYKNGACGSVVNLFNLDFNHKPNFEKGIMETECSEILTRFFKNLREKKAGI
jgi:tRNA(adenine34) deaminase